MLKISTRRSVNLSIFFAVSFIIAVVGIAIALPFVWEQTPYLSKIVNNIKLFDSYSYGKTMFFVWAYLCFALVLECCVFVLLLLLRVRNGLVFSAISVTCIRSVSWLCVLLSLLLVAGVFFHPMMCVLGIAMAFLGLCLRVAKNVIERATEIKQENDYTI